ncbi:MAG: hypothetical protein IKP77_06205 [Acholeplasmatales bacterium]|nr:hypothetical protein [Acholeplasmatales bacterium]
MNVDINIIKSKILKLYKENEPIHIDVNLKRRNVKNALGIIKGVYDNFFIVKSKVNLYDEEFSISYIDILIKNISIKELNS